MPAQFAADQEGVFSLAFSLNINQKKMRSVAKEYTSMKCKEKEDLIEIRVSSPHAPPLPDFSISYNPSSANFFASSKRWLLDSG